MSLSLVATVLFSHRLRRLLNDLAAAAHHIASGNWSIQIPVTGPAEFRVAATAFNDMILTLSRRDREARIELELLQAAFDRYRSVVDAAGDAIIAIDGGGRIRFWNRGAEAVFGYAAHEALGQSLAILIPERYMRAHEDGIEQHLSRDDPKTKTIELHGLRHDGAEIPLELSLSAAHDGQATFYTAVFRDITERRPPEEIHGPVAPAALGAQVT